MAPRIFGYEMIKLAVVLQQANQPQKRKGTPSLKTIFLFFVLHHTANIDNAHGFRSRGRSRRVTVPGPFSPPLAPPAGSFVLY